MTPQEIKKHLDAMFPNSKCELEYKNPFQLIVAVILSAQCTDKRVNLVTEELFKKYTTPHQLAKARPEDVENIIKPCGFYHNKAKNIVAMSEDLVSKFNGKVPDDMDELTTLAGVGRKTANVVLSEAFGRDAIAVDTHVLRVSNRLGFIKSNNPEEVEKRLQQLFPKEQWSKLHLQLVHFGRYKCKALKPQCDGCPFVQICTEKHKNFS